MRGGSSSSACAQLEPVRPRGLDPTRQYSVRLLDVAKRSDEQVTAGDGDSIMRDGVTPPCRKEFDSAIFEITEAK